MATNFPTTLDDTTNLPTIVGGTTTGVSTPLDDPGNSNGVHSTLHNTISDAIIALETKIGEDGSADTTSIDYKLSQLGIIPVTVLPSPGTVPRGQNIYALEIAAAISKPTTQPPTYNTSNPIQQALLVDYIMDEGPMGSNPSMFLSTGTPGTVNDYINAGTSRGHFTWGTDSSVDSPYLSGTDGVGTTHTYSTPTAWTWVVLCQPDTASVGTGFFPLFHEQSGSGHRLGINNGVPFYNSNAVQLNYTGFSPSIGTTLMIAGGYSAGTGYVAAFDAAHLTSTWQTSSESWTGPSPGTDSLYLFHDNFSNSFSGKLYHIRLFNRLLTNTELQELAANPYLVYGAAPMPDSYWIRGENSAGTPTWFDITNNDLSFLVPANNLSDVASAATARGNLVAAKSGSNTDITALLGITGQVEFSKGANVASANDLVLGTDGNVFHVTGTTQVDLITATNWQAGSMVALIFDGIVTVKNNQSASGANKPILLYGATDYVTAAGSVLVLIYDGTDWYDIRRGLTATGGGGGTTLSALTDVDLTSIADGDILTYDFASSLWKNKPNAGGGGGSADVVPVTSIDAPPVTPNSHDMEFDDNGSSLTFQHSAGTLTNASVSNWINSGSTSNPTWNSNSDLGSALVMQPNHGGNMKVYGTFAPTSGTKWLVITHVRLMNANDGDDRINFVVSKDAPSSSGDETGNGYNFQLRNNTNNVNLQTRCYENNNGSNSHTVGDSGSYENGLYMCFLGDTDNSIATLVSRNGFEWQQTLKASGSDNIFGNVAYWWVSIADNTGTNTALVVVDFIRFIEGNNDLFALGGPIESGGIGFPGHIVTSGIAPSVSDGSQATGSALANANDIGGNITATSVAIPTTGTIFSVTFNAAYAATPKVILTPENAITALGSPYISTVSTTGFTVSMAVAPAGSSAIALAYMVIQ